MPEPAVEDGFLSFLDDEDDVDLRFPRLDASPLEPPHNATSQTKQSLVDDAASEDKNELVASSQSSSEIASDDGNEMLLFDELDEDDGRDDVLDDFWLSEHSQAPSGVEESQENASFSENEAMLFDDLSDGEEDDMPFQSQSQPEVKTHNDRETRNIGNDEIRAIIAEGEAFMPNFTPDMTPAERRERIRQKLGFIVTSLLGQLVISTTLDPTGKDNKDEEGEEGMSKEPDCLSLTLPVASRETKGDPKRKRPRMPQFPSDNRGSGAKRFATILRVIDLIDEAFAHNKVITLRDLYYRDKALFGTQMNTNRLVDDLAAQLKIRRRDLNITAAAKGLVFGHLTFKMSSGEMIDCASNPAGSLIPTAEDMRDLDISDQLRFVLIIEKEAIFRSLATANFHNDEILGHSVLITGKGYPDVASRELVHTLSYHLPEHIPILTLVDGDPHGLSIFITYRDGSAAMEHEKNTLIAPRLQWLGVTASDMQDFGIDSDYLLPINERDIKHAEKLLSKPGLDVTIKSELRHILRTRKKAEIQILTSVDQDGLVKYLQKKVKEHISSSHAV